MTKIVSSKILSLPQGWHGDGNNLYLRVNGNSRRWYLRFTCDGRRCYKTLGRFPFVSLKDARAKAISFIASRETWVPDEQERVKIKLYKDVVDEAMKSFKRARLWSASTEASWNNHLVKRTVSKWGKRNITTITVTDVYKLLSPIWETIPIAAKNTRMMLESVFTFAKQMGYYKNKNPAIWEGNLDQLLPPLKKIHTTTHQKAASMSELPDILEQVMDSFGLNNKALAVLFGTLTATRSIEFMAMREEEVNRKNLVWSVPPERRKDRKKESFNVPLTKETLRIIDLAKHENGYIFGGSLGKSLDRTTPSRTFRELEIPITMHGMRSTFFDWGVEHGYDAFLLDKALCHSTGNAVRQAYQRSDCLEQRRPIMQAWADHCLSKVKALPNFRGLFD